MFVSRYLGLGHLPASQGDIAWSNVSSPPSCLSQTQAQNGSIQVYEDKQLENKASTGW